MKTLLIILLTTLSISTFANVFDRLETCSFSCSPKCNRLINKLNTSLENIEDSCTELSGNNISSCLTAAEEAGFSYDRNERTCINAKRGTGECIKATSKSGFSYDRIESTCKN